MSALNRSGRRPPESKEVQEHGAAPRALNGPPLRILHVLESLGRGGAEQALVNILPLMRAKGHVVELATLWPPDDLAPELEAGGVPVHRLVMNHRWNLTQGLPRLLELCRRNHYDIIHGHSFFTGLYIALTRPFLPDVRRVLTFHNLGYDSYPANTAWRKVRKQIDAAAARAIDVRFAVSPAVGDHYREHISSGMTTTLYNGISVKEARPLSPDDREAILRAHGLAADDRVLLMCGRLVHEKGHRFFLKALKILEKDGIRPRALLVGNGPLRDEIANEIKQLGLETRVTLVEAVPHADMVRLMQIAEILVMSSTHEGFPLAPAEAMALGRPVIASSVGGLPDLIEPNISGILVAPGDPAVLAVAIRKLMDNPELRARLGEEGRKRILSNFSAQVAVEKLLNYYRAPIY